MYIYIHISAPLHLFPVVKSRKRYRRQVKALNTASKLNQKKKQTQVKAQETKHKKQKKQKPQI